MVHSVAPGKPRCIFLAIPIVRVASNFSREAVNFTTNSTYFTVISKTAVIPWVHWSYLLAEGV